MKDNYKTLLHELELIKYESCRNQIRLFIRESDLEGREKELIFDYYFDPSATLRGVADKHLISPERVRQILYKGLKKLKHPIKYPYLLATLDSGYDVLVKERDTLRKRLEQLNVLMRDFTSVAGQRDEKDPFTRRVEDVNFNVRTLNVFYEAGIKTVGDLTAWSIPELLQLKNFGKKSLQEVVGFLGLNNLSLRK